MPKVILGLSGGIDSTAALILLLEHGFEPHCIMLRVYDGTSKCSAEKSARLAADITKRLGVPFELIDVRKEFREQVLDYFYVSYKKGETPNPCVQCNLKIKFRYLSEIRQEKGADFIATGHYAKMNLFNGKHLISCSRDIKKDQTYFLGFLGEEITRYLMFPLGSYLKEGMRKIISEAGLPLPEIAGESQDLCFTEDKDIPSFLESEYGFRVDEGDLVFGSKKLGVHKGYPFYTIGQRKRLSHNYHLPLYVREKDIESNTVYIDLKENTESQEFIFSNAVFHVDPGCLDGQELFVKLRHRGEKIKCGLRKENGTYRISLEGNKAMITPGQAAVIYFKDMVCAAGWQKRS